MNEREQIQVDKHVFIDKLKTTKRNFKDNNAADGVFSLLLWFAVLDDVEDILEDLDTVQANDKIGFYQHIVDKRYSFNLCLAIFVLC